MDNLFVFLNKTETSTKDTITDVDSKIENVVVDEPVLITTVKEKKKYDQKKYNSKFMDKNREKIHQKIVCDVCCGSYSYYNKSKHMKSIKHLNLLNKQNQIQ
jgi:hypothetical protein